MKGVPVLNPVNSPNTLCVCHEEISIEIYCMDSYEQGNVFASTVQQSVAL